MKRKMSLTTQLIMTMLILVVGIIGLCFLLNTLFLSDFYLANKQNELLDGFRLINQAAEKEILAEEEFDVPFERLCTNGNINVMIFRQQEYTNDLLVIRSSYREEEWMAMQINDWIYGSQRTETEILLEKDNLIIQKQTDQRMNSEFLILSGTLSDGSGVYMRTALESIEESAKVTNRFFFMAGMVAMLFGIILIFFAAPGIAKPIRELSTLSQRMTELDFEARYTLKPYSSKEIAELGNSMNTMSEALEKTITELKTANLKLQTDIQEKEQIDDMRKEFLSNVSHELKTPLALIQGYAEGLRDGVSDSVEDQSFYCDVIVDEADKMNQMVKKLLSLNELEFGNGRTELACFDITELIRGVLAASFLQLQTQEIEVTFDTEYPVHVWGDEFRIEEVITNYLSNAIHYAAGEKKIRIFLQERDDLLRVSVFNTGNPIPEEELDKIWEKFYKVDKARTREYGGNGIGLSIVKAIMESHNQKYGVINHEDGVEFWIELERGQNSIAG